MRNDMPKYPHVPNGPSTAEHHATKHASREHGTVSNGLHDPPMLHHEKFAPGRTKHGTPARHTGRHLEEHERACSDVPGSCVDHGPM